MPSVTAADEIAANTRKKSVPPRYSERGIGSGIILIRFLIQVPPSAATPITIAREKVMAPYVSGFVQNASSFGDAAGD